MKATTIVPTKYLSYIEDDNYHMCLAHLIEKDPVYTAFYKRIGHDPNKFLIMDNGVIEGDPRPIEEILKKAFMVGADEIILPDVFRNMSDTLDKTYEALQLVKSDFPWIKVMAVPQGNTIEEWLECAKIMLTWDIDTLGIPKVLVHLGGRDARLEVLKELGHSIRGLDIHLLGCWTTPLEVLVIDRAAKSDMILPVRGVDSAIAYVYSRNNILISDDDRPENNSIDFSDNTDNVDPTILEANLQLWREAADIGVDDIFDELFKRLGGESAE